MPQEGHLDAVIVGAGFSGICTAITLKDHFKTNEFIIFDRHPEIGGTWHANTYPGCASDVPAPWYSLSTDLNPDWTAFTPPHSEMKDYLKGVVKNHDLSGNIHLECWVDQIKWDNDKNLWYTTVKKTNGETYTKISKAVFMCQGGLVYPNNYDWPGLKDKFKGDTFHTANWNHDVDLTDKHVIVVGNGCSAAQVIPEIVDQTKSLTQIVRSKHWLYPPPSHKAFDFFKKFLNKSQLGMKFFRLLAFIRSELKVPLFNSSNFLSKFMEKLYTKRAYNHMITRAPEKYHDIMIPDFKLGCKRMVYETKYTDALHKDNLLLTMDEIESVSERAIHTTSGTTYPADVIVAATGYNVRVVHNQIDIRGISEPLREKWAREGISAYETIMVDECPNMFFIAGPNSATGHSSVVLAIENNQLFIKRVAAPLFSSKADVVKVSTEAYQKWKTDIAVALTKCVFSTPFGGCVSWYGTAGNFVAYPWSQLTYWWRMWHPRWKDLEVR